MIWNLRLTAFVGAITLTVAQVSVLGLPPPSSQTNLHQLNQRRGRGHSLQRQKSTPRHRARHMFNRHVHWLLMLRFHKLIFAWGSNFHDIQHGRQVKCSLNTPSNWFKVAASPNLLPFCYQSASHTWYGKQEHLVSEQSWCIPYSGFHKLMAPFFIPC